jgi:hypothetical protein
MGASSSEDRAGPPQARILGLGLSAGLAIALSGCEASRDYNARMRQEELRSAYRSCLYDATGPFGSAGIEVIKDCRSRVYGGRVSDSAAG